jgi:hypothetical protein
MSGSLAAIIVVSNDSYKMIVTGGSSYHLSRQIYFDFFDSSHKFVSGFFYFVDLVLGVVLKSTLE